MRKKGRHAIGQSSPKSDERFVRLGPGIKEKDRMGIPHLLAFALRDDGWYYRDEIIWYKRNGMTSSVADRTAPAHEMVFLLAKQRKYFFDIDAISEPSNSAGRLLTVTEKSGSAAQARGRGVKPSGNGVPGSVIAMNDERFPRSVWSISCKSFKGAHFAVMSPRLAEKCIAAGTSEKGCCPECGSPWVRIVERKRVATRPGTNTKIQKSDEGYDKRHNVIGNRDPERHITKRTVKGWKPTCKCGKKSTLPCIVLDPFGGAGTTCVVAERMGREWLACEIGEQYAKMARERIDRVQPGFCL